MRTRKKSHRELVLGLVFLLSIVGALIVSNSPASGILGVASIITPPVTTSTTFSPTVTTTTSTTSTTTSTSTITSSTSLSTTSTSVSSSFSYTTTVSSTSTSTSTSTSFTSTQTVTATSYSPTPSTTYVVTTQKTTVLPSIVPGCPVAQATTGTALEPYANFLRVFRNNQIQNTTAGRVFMRTFNVWYYSWAPSVTYFAATNPWFLDVLRVGVYPLMGILYASYYSYATIAPISPEAGALAAGIVAASLIGLVYVAPLAYVSSRLVRRRIQSFRLEKVHLFPASGWVAASVFMIGAAYLSGSALFMGLATASLTLSMLSVGSILGVVGLGYVQLPLVNLRNMTFAVKRLIPPLR